MLPRPWYELSKRSCGALNTRRVTGSRLTRRSPGLAPQHCLQQRGTTALHIQHLPAAGSHSGQPSRDWVSLERFHGRSNWLHCFRSVMKGPAKQLAYMPWLHATAAGAPITAARAQHDLATLYGLCVTLSAADTSFALAGGSLIGFRNGQQRPGMQACGCVCIW